MRRTFFRTAILGTSLLSSLGLWWVGVASAVGDQACAYYVGSCSCTWGTWEDDGTKKCTGTRLVGTRYGNTRSACPSSSIGSIIVDYHLDHPSYGTYSTKYGLESCSKNSKGQWADDWWGNSVCVINSPTTCTTNQKTGVETCSYHLTNIPHYLGLKWGACNSGYITTDDCGASKIQDWACIDRFSGQDDGKYISWYSNYQTCAPSGYSATYGKMKLIYVDQQQYRYGDITDDPNTCQLVQFDQTAPKLKSMEKLNDVSSTWTIGYTGGSCDNGPCTLNYTLGTCTPEGCVGDACVNQGCTPPSNAITKSKFIGTWYMAHCMDGESGCTGDTRGFVYSGGDFNFYIYDHADNWAEYNVAGTLLWNGTSGRTNVNNYQANGMNIQRDFNGPSASARYSTTSCTSAGVKVTGHCDSDDTGCGKDYTSPNFMAAHSGNVPAYDTYGNLTLVGYSVDWIKTYFPYNAQMRFEAKQKAGTDGFFLSATDINVGSSTCDNADLQYTMTITGPVNRTFNGTIPRDGTPGYGHFGVYTVGSYMVNVVIKNNIGLTQSLAYTFRIVPGDISGTKSKLVRITPWNTLFANDVSQYEYQVTLFDAYGNIISGKKLLGGTQENYDRAPNYHGIVTDMAAGRGDSALVITPSGAPTSAGGVTSFYVRGRAPWLFTNKFHLQFHLWNTSYIDTNDTQDVYLGSNTDNSFRKPFIGSIALQNNVPLTVGTEQQLVVNVRPQSSLSAFGLSNLIGSLDVQSQSTAAGYVIQNKNSEQNLTTTPSVNYTINYQGTSTIQDTISQVGLRINPYISYDIGGQHVRWVLGSTSDPLDTAAMTLGNAQFTGVATNGLLQAGGKQGTTSQQSNFSDLSKSSVRVGVKQGAQTLIVGMTSGQTVNGVKYIEGNATISGNPTYQTIVVHNGNLIIAWDLNAQDTTFGIIVIRDDQSDESKGNVYVNENVKYIHAAIYADGGIMSSDASGNLYMTNNSTRTNHLQNQLVLIGSLFTRNTIGGAILSSTQRYILPGGTETTDFDRAMRYDLNYLRRSNVGYDDPAWTQPFNQGKADSFVVLADPALLTNPPKGFNVPQ